MIESGRHLDEIRSAFPHVNDLIYMNHAAMAPMSRPVTRALEGFMAERQRENIENYFDFEPVIESAIQRAADILHTSPQNVEFAPNTSYGLNVLAQGINWKSGDRILIPGCEFPANVYPFVQLEQKGVHVDFVPHHEGTFSLEDVKAAITPQTRLLSVSWVQFLSGFRCDLEKLGALCKAHDVLFCVDAIQGLGALQIDVERCQIDFLASGGHKWLMAMQGVGLIYVKESLLDQITPVAGWLNGPVDWERLIDYDLKYHPDARRFRLGTMNAMGVAALEATLAFYQEANPEWCEQHVLELAGSLSSGLEELGLKRYGHGGIGSGIVTYKHAKANEMFEALKEASVHIAVRNGLLRFSPTYYNSSEEVDRVIEVMKKLMLRYPV